MFPYRDPKMTVFGVRCAPERAIVFDLLSAVKGDGEKANCVIQQLPAVPENYAPFFDAYSQVNKRKEYIDAEYKEL